MVNKLKNESSLYLKQHENNPVSWYPWGEEAFSKASNEDKPIFLSIGYSSCHWCHVMAHECFEDNEVATLLNQFFVCIKVIVLKYAKHKRTWLSVKDIVNGTRTCLHDRTI